MNGIFWEITSGFWQDLAGIPKNTGLIQAALAKQVGTSTSYIGYREAGKRMPTLATFITLATALNIEPQELLNSTIRLLNVLQGKEK